MGPRNCTWYAGSSSPRLDLVGQAKTRSPRSKVGMVQSGWGLQGGWAISLAFHVHNRQHNDTLAILWGWPPQAMLLTKRPPATRARCLRNCPPPLPIPPPAQAPAHILAQNSPHFSLQNSTPVAKKFNTVSHTPSKPHPCTECGCNSSSHIQHTLCDMCRRVEPININDSASHSKAWV